MGKYMRKCIRGAMGEEVAAVEVTQVVGVRTRSRSAAAVGAKVQPPNKRRKSLPPAVGDRGDDGGGCCYLQLRSRMLFMAPAPAPAPAPVAEAPRAGVDAGQGAAARSAGLSRCSSTASSVDAAATQDRSLAWCRSDAVVEAGGEHIPEGSASNNSGSGRDRERRETTPSSGMPGEVSELESDLAGQKRVLPSPASTAASRDDAATRAARMMPPASEIEAFFAAAEEAEAKRFAAKYNFDVARGVPLNAGRFEWTPVASR